MTYWLNGAPATYNECYHALVDVWWTDEEARAALEGALYCEETRDELLDHGIEVTNDG